ncbi:MAG TPA: 3-isopropylmalate dehydrogenase [Longimicrobiales bacterium]
MSRIALIPGDGIGTEVVAQAEKALRWLAEDAGLPLELTTYDYGAQRYLDTGVTITDDEMAALEREHDAILLGAMGDPRVKDNRHARDILLGMRFRFDLYVNLRPVKLYDARFSPLRDVKPADVDIVIVRENTEGVYLGMGGVFKRGTVDELAIEEDVNTYKGVERIVRAAFGHAKRTGRKRVTLADKANAMQHAGGLYRRVFAQVAAEFPGIEHEAMYVDALALDVVLRPARYDVIVASNLFGDILSDLVAALAGGLGMAPSANLHPGRIGLFEPVHGSAPDIAGKDRANPMAALMTTALMLEELGHAKHAQRLSKAVERTLAAGKTTPDLGGTLGTEAVGDAVLQALRDR